MNQSTKIIFQKLIFQRSSISRCANQHPVSSFYRNLTSDINRQLQNTLLRMNKASGKKKKNGNVQFGKKSKGAMKYPSSQINLTVLGSGAHGVPPALYIFTGRDSYLFNCGEGTQRLAQENKIKLSTIENILVTHKSWTNVGGIPGMLLTMQDMQDEPKDVKLHGPPGIHTLYTDTRKFVNFKFINLSYNYYNSNDGMFGNSDDPLTIKAIPILSSKEGQHIDVQMEFVVLKDSVPNEENRGKKRMISNGQTDFDTKKSRSEEFTTDMAMAYICRTDSKLGKLSPEACVKAGVTPGPLFAELKKGNDIFLEDGREVKAKDVTEPDDPGKVFIIVEAPTLNHLRTLVNHPAFIPHQENCNVNEIAEVVVHFTPPSIMKTEEYEAWCSKFPPSTTHILLNEDNTCTGSEAVHRMQRKLNYLNYKIFPTLKDTSIPDLQLSDDCDKPVIPEVCRSNLLPSCDNVYNASTFLTYNLRPNTKLSSSQCLAINQKQIETEIKNSGSIPYIANESSNDSFKTEYPIITFLGTGSCLPNKTRNTSSILLQTNEESYLMLDCGEGTYGQLVRMKGKEAAQKIISQLKGVYVSHLHADHHLGFINLMLQRKKVLLERGCNVTQIPLLAPSNIIPFFNSYTQKFEEIEDTYKFINNMDLLLDKAVQDGHLQLYSELGILKVNTCEVDHCTNACGVAITSLNNKKVVYSGDTRPCDQLVHLGMDCDILIHEGTLEDDLIDEARYKMHSTSSEALDIGERMKAKHIILTHFSQRYAKVPLLPSDRDLRNVSVAYDNMEVEIKDLPVLSSLYPQFTRMFSEAIEESKLKLGKKMIAKNRESVIKEGMRNS